jgi:hypothetical protein
MLLHIAPDYILLGDNPTLHAIWPDEPFLWRYDDWYETQPPGFVLVDIGIDKLWAIDIKGDRYFLEIDDIVVYGEKQVPDRILYGEVSRLTSGRKVGGAS